jgi:hypothetical protein
VMIFDALEEEYLEALWDEINAEIDEEEDGLAEKQFEYIKLKYEIRRDKLLREELQTLNKNMETLISACKKHL